ncbi:uncharacterized protein LOC112494783 [Cephus cinctus]|uniref:Uncharacterized protein LOC112494783 n=1 Tax=Cephus cinctus TaxID=211228 RepID=A0AAJ7RNC9_CEPCN|nr:uncharacterized protein LOC112494783 [Cephus cinctus]
MTKISEGQLTSILQELSKVVKIQGDQFGKMAKAFESLATTQKELVEETKKKNGMIDTCLVEIRNLSVHVKEAPIKALAPRTSIRETRREGVSAVVTASSASRGEGATKQKLPSTPHSREIYLSLPLLSLATLLAARHSLTRSSRERFSFSTYLYLL